MRLRECKKKAKNYFKNIEILRKIRIYLESLLTFIQKKNIFGLIDPVRIIYIAFILMLHF